MKVIFLGKNKPVVIQAVKYLLEKGIQIEAIIASPKDDLFNGKNRLIDVFNQANIRSLTDEELYDYFDFKENESLKGIDLVISFLFWKRIKEPLIRLPKIGCINFHPAPLPDFRGLGGYNFAIYEGLSEWGVSAHFVDESFDTGDIIQVNRFKINSQEETAFSLEQKSMDLLLILFKDIINNVLATGQLKRTPQDHKVGRYISKHDFEKLRKISSTDSIEEINKKIRAFWYPPYGGAAIEIQGKEFTLVNDELLTNIAKHIFASQN